MKKFRKASKAEKIDVLVRSGGITFEQGELAKKKWAELQAAKAQAEVEVEGTAPEAIKDEA